ncbi:MAG: bifunctional folylpolyglutamate synthase/dihydrofolate synthase, partial [Gemmatimonadaceae bacterium]|nr:bifunctional folylpolyglutamate synthase/dihydrofolate synthase [Gloeobacterales cyanobacterium ES-bin-141]
IDGAHNPEAAARLRAYLDSHRPGESVCWLIGMLETKDARSILGALLRTGDTVMTVPIAGVASHSPRSLSEIARLYEGIEAQDYPSLGEGLAEVERRRTGLSVLCGSLYLVGEYFVYAHRPNS